MSTSSKVLKLYDEQRTALLAEVVLNGYDILPGKTTVSHGAMRSFRIVKGNLWEPWNFQASLVLSNDLGQDADVKIAALPTDQDSSGLIEFL